jgi:hypothetical protein
MQPFAFHVSAANYRRRPSVRLAVSSSTANPFATRRRIARALVWACVIAGAFVAGQLATMFAVVDVCRVPVFGGAL